MLPDIRRASGGSACPLCKQSCPENKCNMSNHILPIASAIRVSAAKALGSNLWQAHMPNHIQA